MRTRCNLAFLDLSIALLFAVPQPGQAQQALADFGIVVQSENARPVQDAYVALVEEDQPFREPAKEAILANRSSITFSVSPGRYRAVVGAPGFETRYLDVFELAGAATSSQTVTLRPLSPLRGRVLDAQGNVVPGAKVGHWEAFLDLPDIPRRLSTLGAGHLEPNLQTTTRSDGIFELPALPGFRHLIWIEAPGFAPGVLQDVLFRPPDLSGLWEVKLERGASLDVTCSGASQEEGDYLELRQAGSSSFPTPAETLGLWSRSLTADTQRWTSLPAGTYEIWLRHSRRGTRQLNPILLATERLDAGAARSRKLQLPPHPVEPKEEPGVLLRLLIPDFGGKGPIEVTRWEEAGPVPQEHKLALVSGGARLDLPGGCRRAVRFLIVAGGSIGAFSQDQEPPCKVTGHVRLLPGATVLGSLRAPTGERLPATGLLRVARCPEQPGSQGESLGSFPFRIEKGRFEARVPAGCTTSTLEVADFAPLRIEDLSLSPGKSLSLGSRMLQAGGAILARLIAEADGMPLRDVAVEAVPAAELVAAQRAAFATTGGSYQGARNGKSVEGGWVRLYGLPAGDYYLRLLPPGRRYPHFAGPFGVRACDEVLLDSVLLPAAASLEVELRPSASLAEAATGFRVTASPASRDAAQRDLHISPTAAAENRFFFSELPPGRWDVTVLASLRGGQTVHVHREEIELPPGQAPSVTLEIEGGLYRGTVTYLDQPVEGALSLRTVRLDQRYGLTVPLSSEGAFEVLLDRPGVFEARVFDAKGRFASAIVPEVQFEDPDQEVRIELPAGRIHGKVIDDQGTPVPEASVEAQTYRGSRESGTAADLRPIRLRAMSGADGEFLLEGAMEGEWTLSASLREKTSLPRLVQLRTDEWVEGGELELLDARTVHGTVRDDLGAPAQVEGLVSFSPGTGRELTRVVRWAADTQGQFTFDAAGYIGQEANFVLTSPHGGMVTMRRKIADDMVLQVPSQWGEVRVRLTGSKWDEAPLSSLWLVREDGSFAAPRWSQQSDPEVRVLPPLAPGRWRLILLQEGSLVALLPAGIGTQIPPLAAFEVKPGGHIAVEASFKKGE